MSPGDNVFARLRLEFSGTAARLARVPLLGTLLRKIGNFVLPRGTLIWATVQQGRGEGLSILVDARTAAEQRRGTCERPVQEAIASFLSAGQVFYDLGANIGFFSLLAARLVGPTGQVVSFEPDPDNARRLRLAIERNCLPNVTIVEAAVWSRQGTLAFERAVASPDRGTGRVLGVPGGADHFSVRAVTLDEHAVTTPVPDLIKCDVEGAEVEIFRGAITLLATHHPTIICEVHSAENLQALEHLLPQFGYRIQCLEPDGTFPIHILAGVES